MISTLVNIVSFGYSVFGGLKGRSIRRLFPVAVYLLLVYESSFGQTGPGGVGNSISNRLWLKADGNVYRDAGVTLASDGEPVYRWFDYSGNNNHANQSDGIHNPIYRTGVVNGFPAIEFTGDTYIDPGALDILGTGGFSFVTVFRTTSVVAGTMTNGSGDYIIDRTIENNELTSLKIANVTGTNRYGFQKRDNGEGGLGGPVSSPSVSTASFVIIDYMRSRGVDYRLYLNGFLEDFIADGDGDLTPPVPRIGRHAASANNGIKGYIAELIIFDYRINDAQINIINSSLAAKYGLTIDNDKYSFDGTHKYDVAGIGRANNSGNSHLSATSAGILNISTASILNNNRYLLFGHDNASITNWTTTEAPDASVMKIPREWRLSKTIDVGAVSFTVDLTSFPAAPDLTCSQYVLLVDEDGDFSTGAVSYDLASIGSNQHRVNGISTIDGYYVSIGVRRAPTALITPDPAQMCAGGTFNMNGNPTGGSGTYSSHLWGGDIIPLSAVNIPNPTFSSTAAAVYNLTYTVTDSKGCIGSDNIAVTVIPDPTIIIPPVGATICDGGTHTMSVTATSGTPSLIYQWEESDDDGASDTWANAVGGSGSTTPTYTSPALFATKYYRVVVSSMGNGCTNATSTGVAVTDDEDPVVTCPGNITNTADAGSCSYTMTAPLATATDNCSVDHVTGVRSDALALGAPYPVGSTTIVWTATDIHGNVSPSCTQTIIITDDEDPVVTCPGNITNTADAGSCSYTMTAPLATATDNCSVDHVTGVRSDALALGAPYPVGSTTIVWTATDIHGNVSPSCTQTIIITDDEDPVVTCPGNITNTADAGSCSYTMTAPLATATDNCSVDHVTGVRSDALALGAPYPVGSTTIVWTATDIHGNVSPSCTQTIIITDDEDPVVTCPGNITNTADAGSCSYTMTAPLATATDNCSVDHVTGVRSDALALGAPYPVGSTTIVWTATDIHGNVSPSCTQTIIITDDEDPVVTCPGNITNTADAGSCSYTMTAPLATATDNCSVDHVTGVRSDALALGAPYPVGSTTIVWTATDIHGNVSPSCTQTIIITDDEDPVVTCPGNITNTADAGSCSYTMTAPLATATDNCSVDHVTGVRSDALALGAPYPVGSTTIVWTATDIHGNVSPSCTQTIIITDDEDPVVTCPGNITNTADAGSCSYTMTAPLATATDNCSVDHVTGVRSDALALGAPYPVGSTTIVWTATDIHGNVSPSCTQTIIITDDEDPVVTCPGNITNTADAGSCSYTMTAPLATATDNCSVDHVTGVRSDALALGAPYPVGSTTIVWTATDIHGNVSPSCTQTIIITDDEDPVVTCPGNITNTADAGSCSYTMTAPLATATDNCSVDHVTGVRSDALALGAPYPVGSTTIVWTATDIHGNVSPSCTQTIIITDDEDPVVTCPGNITNTADAGSCSYTMTAPLATATDNCSVDHVTGVRSDALALGAPYPVGSTTIVWTATDIHGNVSPSCTQTIIITDDEDPVVTCPGNITNTADAGSCSYTMTAPLATATDNCSVDHVTGVRSDALALGAPYPVGSTTIVWTATDIHGNVSPSCTQTIIITDDEDPVVTCPGNITNTADAGSCSYTMTAPLATATDNCSVDHVTGVRSDALALGAPYPVGSTTIVWTATDIHGNVSPSCTQTIIITDDEDPVVTCPGNITNTADAGSCSYTMTAPLATATDNCSVDHVTGVRSDALALGAPYPVGSTTIVWTATDIHGNVSPSCTQTIIITDDEDPVVTCPGNITNTADAGSCSYTMTAPLATATDNCSVDHVTGVRSDALALGAPYPVGSTTIVWTATDIHGNVSPSCTQTIIITDDEDPVVTCPGNITNTADAGSCSYTMTAPLATATDNCSVDHVTGVRSDALALGAPYPVGSTTIVWTATDIHGNVSPSCTQTIIITDDEDPVVTCPGNITNTADAGSCSYTMTAPLATATDNCSVDHVTGVRSDALALGAPYPVGSTTIVWTATDIHGNVSPSCTQTIIITDDEDPVVTCPGNITNTADAGSCSYTMTAPLATATDNCSVDHVTGVRSDALALGAPYPVGSTTIVWTATDIHGNVSPSCTQTIIITDDEDPVVTCPGNITNTADAGSCSYTMTAPLATATDNCSVDHVTGVRSDALALGAPYPVGSTTIVWTATDIHGNVSPSCTQTIIITDDEDPVVTCPGNITNTADAGSCSYTMTAPLATATDNCSVDHVTGVRSDALALGAPYPVGSTTIVWTATDIHGNVSPSCTQTIIITDDEDPVVTCPGNITNTADAGSCSYTMTAPLATATDNCSVDHVTGVRSDALALGAPYPVGSTTIVWTATDIHGNVSPSCTQTIIITDDEDPVVTCPGNITNTADAGSCSYTMTAPLATATDNCSVDHVTGVRSDALALGAPYPVGSTTIVWTATDIHGNVSPSCTQTIIITDDEDPVVTCPGNITNTADAGSCSYTMTAPLATATDNCSVDHVTGVRSDALALGAPYPVGSTTIVWTATDIHGNVSPSCTQTIIITDDEDPVVTCPGNITNTADAGSCSYTMTAPLATATDNCSVDHVTGVRSDALALGAPYPVGSTTIVWTATDIHGNVSPSCTQTIIITDDEDPVVTCPGNITNTADAGSCSYTMTAPLATATDNCSVDHVTGVRSDALALGAPYPVGSTTIVWTATDIHGNVSPSCTQTIIITDDEDPVVTCPGNITNTADAGSCSYTMTAPLATATDNCSVDHVTGVRSDALALGAPYPVGSTTIVWTATDIHGNVSPSCTQTIIITDDEDPVVTCPGNITNTADAGSCSYTMTAPLATATDNCSVDHVTGVRSDALALGAPYPVGSTTIVWTATDIHGNVSPSCTQTIIITDDEDPVVTCPGNITNTADAGSCSYTMTAPLATATDNCSVDHVTGVRSDALALGAPYPVGSTTIVWTATDIHGNVSPSCTQTIIITDDEDPVVTCPGNITNTADAGSCSYTMTAPLATATDNCSVDHVTGVRSDALALGAPYPVGSTTIVWTATDIHGNVSPSCTQTIIITDDEDPVVTCPGNITNTADAGSCSYTMTAPLATATDNCSVDHVTGVRSDALALGAPYPVGSTTIVWTATDIHGNVSPSCTQTIIITDDEDPVVTCPGNITNTADAGSCSYTMTAPLATATDNCSVDHVTGVRSDALALGAPYPVGSTTIVWTATDIHGNVSPSCTQTIIITDDEDPVVTCPGNITNTADAGSCSYTMTAPLATATDNCSVDHVTGVRSDALALGAPYPVGSTTIVWTATDIHGNVSPSCTQTIIITDDEDPVALCKNISINLDLITGIQTITTADINNGSFDNCGIASISASKTDFDCTNIGANNVTLTVTDIHGNISSCNAIVTVNYSVSPDPAVAPLSAVICNGGTTNFTLTNNIPGTTWTWIVTAPPQISGGSDDLTGTKASIQQTLVNSDNIAYKVVYTIFSKIYNSCSLAPITAEVWVEPTPRATIGTTTPVICNGSNINVTINSPTISTQPDNLSYIVTVTSTDAGHLGGTAIAGFTKLKSELPFSIIGTLTNSGDAPIVVTYTVTPRLNGCSDGPVQTVTVSVNPTPQVFPSSVAQTICNDGAVSVLLSSPSTFTSGVITFNYTATATGLVTGFLPAGTWPKDHTISDVLHNPTDVPQYVTYIIVPVSPNGCASGPAKTIVITVEPTPQVVPVVLNQTMCNSDATNIKLTSPSIFENGVITFNYTVDATGGIGAVTGFTTPVAGLPKDYTISDILVNHTDQPQTVTYTIVPISPICNTENPIKTVIITINPTPQVVPDPLTQTLCNNGTSSVTLGSPSTFSNGLITFKYTSVASGNPGDVMGFTPSAINLPRNHVITDILVNHTDQPQTVTYTITPVSPSGCIDGPTKTVIITINPTPQVVPSTLAQTLCNDGTTSVTLGSPSTFSNGLITFNYTVVATGGVTGFTAAVTGRPKDHIIADILHNPTDSPQTATYTIVPISPSGCTAGPTKTVIISINPTPQVVPDPLTQTLCNNGTSSVTLGSPSTFSNGLITFKYTSVASGNPGDITGFTPSAINLPRNHVITDILVNHTDQPQTVTYTITPVSPSGCIDGPMKTVIITINPTPQVVPSTLAQTLCNDGTTSVTLGSPSTFSNGPITFNYTVVATGGVTGFTTPVTGRPKDHIIADILHNPGDSPQTATYTIVPISPSGCTAGPTKTVIITINPTPQVVPSTLAQTLCNDGTTSVTLGSPSTFSNGPITFNYTIVATGGVTGFTTPVTGRPKDHVIADVLHNPTDSPQTATYTIVPISPSGCAAGPVKVVVITVNPTPQVVPSTLAQTLCNDGTTSVTLGSPSTFSNGLITFNYKVVVTGGVTGFTTPVTGRPKDHIIADVLHNPTDSPQTATYTIVPISPSGCTAGPTKTVIITINPTPQVVPSTLAQTLCNDGTTSVTLGSPSTFSNGLITFNYTVVVTGGVTGFTTPVTGRPKDHIIADVLHNPGDSPQTATYTIVPISPSGCAAGPGKVVIITINPAPRLFPTPVNTTQCDNLTTNILLQSPSTFTSGVVTFKYTVTATGLVSGYATSLSELPNNHLIADNLSNQTDTFRIVTYRVVPVSPTSCPDGTARNITVTVNPTPRAVPVNPNIRRDSSICYGGTTQIVLNSPTLMTSGALRLNYTASATGAGAVVGNTSPEVNRTPGYTISRTYQNNSDTIQSVYYYITPFNNAICLPGVQVRSEIKVHAHSLQSLNITKPLTCEGGPGLAALEAEISKGADPYKIIWDGPVSYHKEDSLAIANLSSGKYIIKVTDNRGCFSTDSASIVPKTAIPYISAALIPPGNYNISCIGSNDGTILVSVFDGITPPYNYTLLKNDTDVISTGIFTDRYDPLDTTTFKYFYGLGAGSYTLRIRDVNGCENTDKIIFRVPPPIVVGFDASKYTGGYNISCKGYNNGSAWIKTISGGRPGYTYRWYTYNGNIPGPVNTNRIDNITAGMYFLETRDILNCPKIDSILITEPPGMQLTGSDLSHSPDGNFNISCMGASDGKIDITISGGTGNPTFSWTGPAGFSASTEDISGLTAGVYICTVRDINGCILVPSPAFTLLEPTALAFTSSTSISNDGAYDINCNGGTGSIFVTVTGGSTGNYTYTWTTLNGSGIVPGQEDQTTLAAGTYKLVIKDLNNCEISFETTLTQPPPLTMKLSPTNITCNPPGFNNGSIDLYVTGAVVPYSFSWSGAGGFTATTEDISGLTEGLYQVTVTYNSTCSETDSARIFLPPPLTYTKILSDYNGFNISCSSLANGFINITPTSGDPPLVYNWTGPGGFIASTEDITNLIAGQYNLQITDSNFCSVSESIDLTEPGNLGIIAFHLSQSVGQGFNINCAGDSTGWIDIEPVNQVGTVHYLWSDGIFGRTRNNLPAGDYSVIITDANNCYSGSSITLTEPDSMKLSFNITQPFCPDTPDGEIRINVTGGESVADYSYLWSNNSTSGNLTNITAGFYSVTVTDLNGCFVKESMNVDPVNKSCLIIPNAISPNGDLINDVWNIGMIDLYPNIEVKIFNRWGQTLWVSEKGYPTPWNGKSNGVTLPIDSYHYIIDLHNGSKPILGNVTVVK